MVERSRVSAILPNYNHGHVLPEAIAALRAQTLAPHEIIVVDDGSTDDSRAVVAALSAGEIPLRLVVHEVNRGAIAALNTGIAAATGDTIYMGAADDAAAPTMIERLSAAFAANPGVGLVCGEAKLIDVATGAASFRPAARPSSGTKAFTAAETRDLVTRIDNFIMTGAALFDREKLIAAGSLRPELRSFADGFAVRQLALRHGFVFVPEVFVEWRVSAGGVSRSAASDPAEVERLLGAMRSAFAADPAFPPDYAARFERRWKFGVLRLALADPAQNRAFIEATGPGPLPMRRLLAAASRLPVVGRFLGLAAITTVYRPFSPASLLATAFGRMQR